MADQAVVTTPTPGAPAPPPSTSWFSPERPSYKWWVTLALMLGILTQGLNFGTVNVALPSMMTSMQAEVDTIQWVITSFMITRTVVMPMVGWVAAVLGPRTFYQRRRKTPPFRAEIYGVWSVFWPITSAATPQKTP